MTFYAGIENNLKNLTEESLKVLEYYYGIDLFVYKQTENEYSEVYGISSGAQVDDAYATEKIIGILIGDDFFETDKTQAGTFQEGWLYTRSDKVDVGDVISVKRFDDNQPSKSRKYKVTYFQALGTTVAIIGRWKLSALG